MPSYRKVRAGWYTLPIVHWREVLDQVGTDFREDERLYEEYVDVSRDKHDKNYWIVSIRGGKYHQDTTSELNQHSLFRATAMSFAEAKRYGVALRAYLKNEGEHPDYLHHVFSDEREIALRAMLEQKHGKPYAEIAKAWGIKVPPLYSEIAAAKS